MFVLVEAVVAGPGVGMLNPEGSVTESEDSMLETSLSEILCSMLSIWLESEASSDESWVRIEAGTSGPGVGISKEGRTMGGRVTVVVGLADVKIAFRGKSGKCTSNTRGSHSRMHSQRQCLRTSENCAGAREQSVFPDQHDNNSKGDVLDVLSQRYLACGDAFKAFQNMLRSAGLIHRVWVAICIEEAMYSIFLPR